MKKVNKNNLITFAMVIRSMSLWGEFMCSCFIHFGITFGFVSLKFIAWAFASALMQTAQIKSHGMQLNLSLKQRVQPQNEHIKSHVFQLTPTGQENRSARPQLTHKIIQQNICQTLFSHINSKDDVISLVTGLYNPSFDSSYLHVASNLKKMTHRPIRANLNFSRIVLRV